VNFYISTFNDIPHEDLSGRGKVGDWLRVSQVAPTVIFTVIGVIDVDLQVALTTIG
jgi:hypothetical protein